MQRIASNDWVPVVLPHFEKRGRELYFLISRRPSLTFSERDEQLFAAIDGRRTVGDLRTVREDATEVLCDWRDKQIVVLKRPRSCSGVGHIVIVEPHMDDALASNAGRLLARTSPPRTTVLSVVTKSAFTSYLTQGRLGLLDVQRVSELRRAESLIATALVGAEHAMLDETDAPLEVLKFAIDSLSEVNEQNLAWLTERGIAWNAFRPSRDETSRLAEKLWAKLQSLRPSELWIPLGLGDHVDHVRTREACLRLLVDNRAWASSVQVQLYEDVPYRIQAPDQLALIEHELRAAGMGLERVSEDVADFFDEKLEVLGSYASQVKLSYFAKELIRIAEDAAGRGGGRAEVYYRLTEIGRLPERWRLQAGAAAARQTRKIVAEWLATRESFDRLEIIVYTALGRWDGAIQGIVNAFPSSRITVRVREEFLVETTSFSHPSLEVEIAPVAKDLIAMLRLGGPRTRAVLIFSGPLRSQLNRMLPAGMLVVVPTFAEFCLAVEDLTEAAARANADLPASDPSSGVGGAAAEAKRR
jgi:LmbE family N-acetylglucosaminyl deacetylase